MDFQSLKKSVEAIEMPDEMRARILHHSEERLVQTIEEHPMRKTNTWIKRPVTVAAVLMLCVCLAVAGAAMGNAGFFRDVTRWDGAVTGTVYEQATNEIAISAVTAGDTLAVTATFLTPDSAPYSECEVLAIGAYQIVDADGTVIAEAGSSDSAALVDGRAAWTIPLDGIADGAYTLRIQSFMSSKKADQPLPISGFWECEFTK